MRQAPDAPMLPPRDTSPPPLPPRGGVHSASGSFWSLNSAMYGHGSGSLTQHNLAQHNLAHQSAGEKTCFNVVPYFNLCEFH